MTRPAPSPDESAPSRLGVALASGLGLGRVPRAPGTAGSLGAALLFALLYFALEGTALQLAYSLVLVALLPLGHWSIGQGLRQWRTPDPRIIVMDEVVGQWVSYGGVLLLPLVGGPAGGGWKYLLPGFILFRAFDVLKPFPIRRSERLAGAAGVLLDDVLAGLYAAAGLLLLGWSGWLL